MKANRNWKTIAGWVLHGLIGGIMILAGSAKLAGLFPPEMVATLAHDFAVGGSASAAHANDDAARTFVENSWFFRRAESMSAGIERTGGWFPLAILLAVIILLIAFWFVAYRRRQQPA
jgi:hypothetical protein